MRKWGTKHRESKKEKTPTASYKVSPGPGHKVGFLNNATWTSYCTQTAMKATETYSLSLSVYALLPGRFFLSFLYKFSQRAGRKNDTALVYLLHFKVVPFKSKGRATKKSISQSVIPDLGDFWRVAAKCVKSMWKVWYTWSVSSAWVASMKE